jgi:energy-coupling factor transporter transmembrane protein EcfT
MASPRRRIIRLLLLVFTFVLWMAVLASIPSRWFRGDPPSIILAAAPPLFTNLALLLILIGEWKSGTGFRQQRTAVPTEWEIIPVTRLRPPGLDTRMHRRRVVVVPKRHIRRLARPTPVHQKRRALGLPELPPGGLNRRRPHGWHRRLAW